MRGRTGPKEVMHAELVTEWVRALQPDPSEALLLAARGHHFRRWTSPRSSHPTGRAGYLKWRRALQQQEARELGDLLERVGYDPATIARVQTLVRKQGLGRDPEVQVLEDALCLVFLETQLADVAAKLDDAKLVDVLQKTAKKMSDAGRAAIDAVPLDPDARALLDTALATRPTVVHQYLDGLASQDWDAVAATLATDVHRIGPYRDAIDGRDAYAAFLRDTIAALSGYELVVDRVIEDGATAIVELSETVDDGDARLRTQEAVVFDVADGLITRVAVYLQTSQRLGRE